MSSTPIFNPGQSASGANLVKGNFQVTGNTTLQENLIVGGNETVNGNLTVIGTISSGGGGGSGVFGSLTVSGDSQLGTIGSVAATHTSKNTLDDGSGNAEFSGSVKVDGTLVNATGNTINLPASAGTIALTSQLPSGTFVTPTTLNNNTLPASLTSLAVSGTTTLSGSTSTGSLTSTSFSNSGTTSLSGTTTVGTINGGAATFSSVTDTGNLNVTGTGTFSSSIVVPGTAASGTPSIGSSGNYFNLQMMTNRQLVIDGSVTGQVGVNARANSGTVGQTLALNNDGSPVYIPGTLQINQSTITGNSSAVNITLPNASGTVALTSQLPAGTAVTTTTLNNNSLPASLTSVTSSGPVVATGAVTSNTGLGVNSASTGSSNSLLSPNSLGTNGVQSGTRELITVGSTGAFAGGYIDGIKTAAGSSQVSIGTVAQSGSVNAPFLTYDQATTTTSLNGSESISGSLGVIGTVSGGAANFSSVTSSGTVTVNNGIIQNTSGAANTFTLPASSGTLALQPTTGSYVTTTTLNNATLPASLTTLNVVSPSTSTITNTIATSAVGAGSGTSVNRYTSVIGAGATSYGGYIDGTSTAQLRLGTINAGTLSNPYITLDPNTPSTFINTPLNQFGGLITSGPTATTYPQLQVGTQTGKTGLQALQAAATAGPLYFQQNGGAAYVGNGTNAVVLNDGGNNMTVHGNFTNDVGSATFSNAITVPGTSATGVPSIISSGNYFSMQMQTNQQLLVNGNTFGQVAVNARYNSATSGGILILNGDGSPVQVPGTLTVGGTQLSGSSGGNLTLPNATGTVALTSQLPTTYNSLSAGGGPGSYSVFSTTGTGLSLNTSTGAITFTAPGKYRLLVSVYGSVAASSTASVQWTQGGGPWTVGPSSVVGSDGNTTLAAVNRSLTATYLTTLGASPTSATQTPTFTNITPSGSGVYINVQQMP